MSGEGAPAQANEKTTEKDASGFLPKIDSEELEPITRPSEISIRKTNPIEHYVVTHVFREAVTNNAREDLDYEIENLQSLDISSASERDRTAIQNELENWYPEYAKPN